MTELQLVETMRQQAVVSSLQVAEHFHKSHNHVLRDINNLLGGVSKIGETPSPKMFFKSTYTHEQNGETYPMYYMNRDGFSLLVMGFTGKKALEWKLKYIAAFNAMEKRLAEIQSQEYLDARKEGKAVRREFTDEIKRYAALAESQGHKGTAKFAYSNITKLVKKPFGARKDAGTGQLVLIAATEQVLQKALAPMIDAGQDAKEIYAALKGKVDTVAPVLLGTA